MSGTAPRWPRKTRELHNHHVDSTVWNDFAFRDDDIVIATYTKSGTTWTQQIVAQLLFQGAEGVPVAEMSPWLDLRVPSKAVKLMVESMLCPSRIAHMLAPLPRWATIIRPRATSGAIRRMARAM